jgi:hypothetical protein
MIRKNLQRHLKVAALLFIGCTMQAFGTVPGPDNMTLTGVNAGYVMGGVYTSPYNVTVNGTPMLLICDDFTFEIPSIPWSWTATTTDLSALPSSTPRFNTGNEVYNYSVAAVLASELMSLPNLYSEAAGELSYAIWGIFDPVLLSNNPASGVGHLTSTELCAVTNANCSAGTPPGYLDQARAIVDAATNNGTLSSLPQITIYTPINFPPGNNSQEFIGLTAMPEPSSLALLGLDLLGLAGLVFFIRRRRANALR